MDRRSPDRQEVRDMVDKWQSMYGYRPPAYVLVWMLMRVLNRRSN